MLTFLPSPVLRSYSVSWPAWHLSQSKHHWVGPERVLRAVPKRAIVAGANGQAAGPTRRIALSPSARGAGDCIFCQIVSRRASSNIVYEDEKYIAFLDIFPFSRGHTLVCPKEHGETIWDMKEMDIAGLFRVASKVSRAVVIAVEADGFRCVQNNGEAANQVVAHVHVHVIPVKMEDKGRFGDTPTSEPSAGSPGPRKSFTQKEMDETAMTICAEMDRA